ncbi:flavodoxin [Candidatus Dojkabacteria bacterium]|nr:flavodoxin [Candidatus Dojkabacteria bacterium]
MKAIVVYGSTTGNTEEVANYVVNGLKDAGHAVTLKNVMDANPGELKDYDLVALGSSTWNEGELQDDFIPFYEQMDEVDLKGKKAIVFGCGESIYDNFCTAVDILEKKLKELGAEIVADSFKIDGDIGEYLPKVQEWASKVK